MCTRYMRVIKIKKKKKYLYTKSKEKSEREIIRSEKDGKLKSFLLRKLITRKREEIKVIEIFTS